MWQYALWGLGGAAINRALIFLEANSRVKGPAWRYPEGPGARFFLLAVVLHCAIGAAVTYAAAVSGLIHEPLLGLGLGAAAPIAMKTVGRVALAALPAAEPQEKGAAEPPEKEKDSEQ